MSDYIYINGELYHHGVKGMKWGVRRYQNKDGSLTPAGKKRYYTETGFLTEEGRKQRDANSRAIYEKSIGIRNKISRDSEYKRAADELRKSKVANRENYAAARERWLSGKDFKNMDYYQFKDAAYDRWIKSDAGKTEADRQKAMRSVIEKKVKDSIGDKFFNQTLPELNATSYTKTLGQDYVNRIFNLENYAD